MCIMLRRKSCAARSVSRSHRHLDTVKLPLHHALIIDVQAVLRMLERISRRLEVCRRRCAMAGVSFSMLCLGSFVCQKHVHKSAERTEPSETPWHTYDDTPTTA